MLERAVGKNEKLESFKLESLKFESLKLESFAEVGKFAAVGKFWMKLGSLNELGKLRLKLENSSLVHHQTYQLQPKLSNSTSNFNQFFPTSAKLSNLGLSNFSFFLTALFNYTYPIHYQTEHLRRRMNKNCVGGTKP